MRPILSAALVYALIVFAIGFGLGTLRTLFLIPLVGVFPAVLIELPFMWVACWFVARWVVTRNQVPPKANVRLGMGAGALCILTCLEALTAVSLFGLPLPLFFSGYLTLPGLAGLGGQLIFAAIPALLLLARR